VARRRPKRSPHRHTYSIDASPSNGDPSARQGRRAPTLSNAYHAWPASVQERPKALDRVLSHSSDHLAIRLAS